MNNDIYNNKSGSSLQDAYARLNEAIKIRNASAKGQQYDNANGVALNTTPIVNNASQGQQVQQQATPVTDDNIAIRTAGTVEQALRNIKSGFLNLGEGVIDAHIALAGIVNKEWAEEAIKFDISDTITEWMDNNLSANALYKSKTGNNLYDQSWLNDADEKIQNIVMGVEQGIGNALGFMALSSVPYVGVALTWEGSSGMALEEAINDPYYNGNYYGAAGSAILKGGVETGLEYLLGWNPKKMGVSTKTFKTVVKELGKNFAEEGLEEVASDLITPLFDGMYTDKTLAESYDNVTLESLGETFLVGGLTGALMTGAGEVASAAYLSPEGQRIAHDIKENEEYYQQAYEKFKNNPNEEQALEEFNKVKEEVANNLLNLGQRITKLNEKYQNRIGKTVEIDGETYTVGEQVQMKGLSIGLEDARIKAIEETKDLMVKSGVPELADYKVKFITDPKKNGSIDPRTKTISINLNTQKAAKFILGHEITHAFENNTAYKKVYDEILTSLKNSVNSSKDSTVYEELYNAKKESYKEEIEGKTEAEARKYLEKEIVADYMGNNFKNFAEIQKLFTKQSTWEKFKDMIKGIRKENKSSKAKEYYQRFLKESYGTKVEEKKQPKLKLAGVKYSIKETKNGKKYVEIDFDSKIQQELNSLSPRERQKKVEKYIREYFSKLDYNNQTILITGKTADKLTNTLKEEKIRAVAQINELLNISKYIETKETSHRLFDKIAYLDTMFKVGNTYYNGIINLGFHRETKTLQLYELNQIKKVDSPYNESQLKAVESTSNIIINDNSEESNTKYSKSSPEVEIDLENSNKDSYIKAKKEFGTTYRLDYAGWLNVDGTMLDFSDGQGYRVQDHREIENIYKDSKWTDALIQYLAEGNIRLQSYGFEIWKKPTKEQIAILKKHIRNNYGEVVVDIDYNKNGDTKSYEYERGTPADKIIEDINNYFDKGIEPIIDRSDDIRYSKVDTANEIANTSKQIQKEVQKAHDFVKDNKQYQEDTIKALKQLVDSYIQNINHTKKGGKDISKDARSVLVNLRGDKFLTNEFIANSITPEQKNYLEAIFSFLEERINKLNYSKRKTIPVLDYETKIDNMDGYDEYADVFRNKTKVFTEGDVVLSALRVINKVLNNANNDTVKLNGEELNRKTATQDEVNEQAVFNKNNPKAVKGILRRINQIATSMYDGAAYFDILGHCRKDSMFNKFYQELYNAYINKLNVAMQYQKDINEFIKNNKAFVKKLKSNKHRISFANHDVLLGEAISLYMALDADNTAEHLLKADRGGVIITRKDGGRGTKEGTINRQELLALLPNDKVAALEDKKIKGKERKDLYKECGKIIQKQLGEVIGLDATTKDLIGKLKKHYKDSGELYQQVAQEYNGFSYPPQETYYPLKSDIASFNKQSGTLDTTGNFMNDTMNPSFTKSLSKNASNAIQISDVLETYVHFSEQLATWSQISVKVKQIDRFLNTTVKVGDNVRGIKFREYINQYIDPDFQKRWESLVLGMQGINRTNKTEVDKILNKIRGINASISLGFNAKTIMIQPTAYFKFWHYVSPKNWLKAFGSNKGLKNFKWLVEHSALVYDRYYGNQGRNVAEAQTVGAARSLNAIGKVGMEGITQADKLPLILGWKAIQLEAQEKGITDETEILKMFEKAMYETQATHDALSNGSAVRVDNEIAKSFLMFSSENRKTLSRFFHSLYAIKANPNNKAAWREFSASTTSMVASAAVMAAIASVLKRLKGDDEEEFIEAYGKEFAANMVGVFPVVSNLYNSLVNGYDLQLTGFSQITDLLDLPQYCETLMSTNASESAKTSAIVQIAQRISHVVGIPFRNIYNDILYIAGLGDFAFNTEMVLKLKNLYYNTNNSSLTTLAKTYSKRGDKDKVSAVIQIKSKNYGAGEISDKVSNEFARLYMNGSLESFPSQLQDEYTVEGTLVKMNKEEYKHAQSVYELANEQMELMMSTSQYLGLTDEEKAIAIKKLYSAYYDVAKSDTIGVEGTKFSKVSKYIDTGKYASYLAKIQSMKANTLTNKKEAVQAYVNRTNLSKAEKYLLAYLAGYSIADDGKTQVAAYLRSKGMSYKDSKTFTGIK